MTPKPAYADLEIRILEKQAKGYPVEITLNSEQEFPPTTALMIGLRFGSPET